MKEKHTYRPIDTPDKSLPEVLRVNPYTVPDGYFTDLQECTLQQCRLIEEVQHIKSIGSVPTGYFDQLGDRILAKIKEQQLKETITESGFSIPDGYFDKLEEQLLLQQKLNENASDSGFSVPASYFETLQDNLSRQTYQQQEIPIRKISRPRWMAYAAACIALVASIVGVTRLAVEDQPATSSHLASVSDQEILNYLELYGTDNDMMYISEQLDDFDERVIGESISEEDLEAYLNHTL
ncbi:hypothetical protein [Parapedobacter defluvii]|uniref:hypothetical protein n=1 Tax=Parapedobacter defluvii TaxID=2045106 RepID=UPI000FA6DFB7|nr:MAG: hypothetical protein EAS52_21740 [Parapedobacter sp.]